MLGKGSAQRVQTMRAPNGRMTVSSGNWSALILVWCFEQNAGSRDCPYGPGLRATLLTKKMSLERLSFAILHRFSRSGSFATLAAFRCASSR